MVAALLLVGSLPPLKADNDGAPAGKPVRGEKRIKEAVESGKITKEEARERLEAMRKAAGANRAKAAGGGMTIEDYRRGEARIKAAVQAGQISREDRLFCSYKIGCERSLRSRSPPRGRVFSSSFARKI